MRSPGDYDIKAKGERGKGKGKCGRRRAGTAKRRRPRCGPSPLPPSFPLLHACAGGTVLYHKSCEMWLNTKPFSPVSVTHEDVPESSMKGEEKKLLELFGRLASEQQDKLIAFAEFLSGRE